MLVFLFTTVLPGDIAERVLGRESTAQQRQIFDEHLHLDQPVYERYGSWAGGVVRGDLGRSLVNDDDGHLDDLAEREEHALPGRLRLPALPAGDADPRDASRRSSAGKLPDGVISLFTLIGLSLPEFVLGTLLIFTFAVKLSWAPALSIVNPGDSLVRGCTPPCCRRSR